ncbi:MAG: hypothetical protein HY706_14370 [Candidatus Hydrogenedentes bacterium]|nr:hypothetical protein [Candidatus Hydrogenedentota bacterium]
MKRLLLCLFVLVAGGAFAEFRAAITTRVITPNPLLPVSGGIGTPNPVKEKRGELTVRALVFEQEQTRVAIVSGELLGFPGALCNKVRSQVRGIPAENILIGATHTHSGPDCFGFPDEKGQIGCDVKWLDNVCKQMAYAVNEALAHLQPAAVKIATGEVQGKIAYNYYAPQLYDPRCSVIQCVDESGKPFATLVNYAIHAEILGDSQGILSPDLCGPLYDRITEQGGGTGMFMCGAQGGMITADNRDPNDPTGRKLMRTWEECLRIGTLLADEALRVVKDAPIQENPGLVCVAKAVAFPVTNEPIREIAALSPLGIGFGPDNKAVTQVNLVNLGNAQMLTVPGEPLPNIGYYLKRKMKGEHNLLFGSTNDQYAYIMTEVDWGSFKRYEYVSRTGLGEMTGGIFIEEALKMINEAPAPERASGI